VEKDLEKQYVGLGAIPKSHKTKEMPNS